MTLRHFRKGLFEMKHIPCIVFIIIGLFAISCSGNQAAEKYIRYLDKAADILGDQKIEPSKKGAEILAFAERNKAEIEKTIADLRAMTPKQAEGIVDKVRTKNNKVLESIQSLSNASPEIAEDQNLYKALVLLKVIGDGE